MACKNDNASAAISACQGPPLGYWATGLLGYWATGLLGYWAAGLLGLGAPSQFVA